ncbi:MAG: peptidase family protein [Thermoleophilia bacterium]|nr:peptidase family protein [Thermoleophilia bacterium]
MISTAAVRGNANPGIVPPWLQGADAGTPTAAAPATAVARGAHAAGTTHPIGVIGAPARDVNRGVVIIGTAEELDRWLNGDHGPQGDFGHGHDHGGAGLAPDEHAAPYRHDSAKEAAELVVAKQEMSSIRDFFRTLGVKDSEGNDPAPVSIDDSVENAYYDPNTDEVVIGELPLSQIEDGAEDVSFTKAPDVLAHEWSHRIVSHLVPGIQDGGEDAAINESLADTFAAAYDTKNWTIGEGLGLTIRTLDHPERDTIEHAGGHPGSVADVDRMFREGSEYITEEGQPEPHALSALPSKAASLIGQGLGRDTMAKIYLKAVRDYMEPGKKIEGLASNTIQSATDLFGAGSKQVGVVKQAWDAVGVLELLDGNGGSTRDRASTQSRMRTEPPLGASFGERA